jgi:hypothetical protein
MADTALPIRPPGPHPTPEQLYRARHGPRASEAERWLAHAAVCAACSEELLRQEAFDAPQPMSSDSLATAWKRFGQAPPAPLAPVLPISRIRPTAPHASAAPVTRSTRSPWRPAVLRWAVAATLAAAVGLGAWSHTRAPRAALSNESAAWQPAGLLDAPPTELHVPARADGAPRRVTVFDISRSYSWTSPPTAGGRIAFPEMERRKLQRGVAYFWTVAGEPGMPPRSFRLR